MFSKNKAIWYLQVDHEAWLIRQIRSYGVCYRSGPYSMYILDKHIFIRGPRNTGNRVDQEMAIKATQIVDRQLNFGLPIIVLLDGWSHYSFGEQEVVVHSKPGLGLVFTYAYRENGINFDSFVVRRKRCYPRERLHVSFDLTGFQSFDHFGR